jgi:predicted amino acid dehydrogenase
MRSFKGKRFCFIAHPVETWNWRLYSNEELNRHPPTKRPYPWLFPVDIGISCYFLLGKKPFDKLDEFNFNGNLKGETYLVRNFGWHFMLKGQHDKIRKRILQTVLHIQQDVDVIGLGALTKAEWLTKGGQWIVDELGDNLKVPVVHGDTLTAVTVTKQVHQLSDQLHLDTPIFITGATSKIGRAVTLALAAEGHDLVMMTESAERFQSIRKEAGGAGKRIRMSTSLAGGKDSKLWITGKANPSGQQVLNEVPEGAAILNFSVPNPVSMALFRKRPDITALEGGLLAYDPARTTLKMTMRLRPGLTYACHAGTMVHAYKGWDHHESGPVELSQMTEVWRGAMEIGFSLPQLPFDHNNR